MTWLLPALVFCVGLILGGLWYDLRAGRKKRRLADRLAYAESCGGVLKEGTPELAAVQDYLQRVGTPPTEPAELPIPPCPIRNGKQPADNDGNRPKRRKKRGRR